MSRTTTICCDHCAEAHSGPNHAGLWQRLHRAGWAKGPRIKGVSTHFCEKAACQQTLQKWQEYCRIGQQAGEVA